MTSNPATIDLFFDDTRSARVARGAGHPPVVPIGGRPVGDGHPVFVIAEIGINHNGSLDVAKELIVGAARAGCDAVKFQKRTPELCVPKDQWNVPRDTPWGRMTYIDYRRRTEFGRAEYEEIARLCREIGIQWFASSWDVPSVEFMEAFDPPCYKVASASITDHALLRALRNTQRPVILSTGMSTWTEIRDAVSIFPEERLLVAHATSTYPCPTSELNLRVISALKKAFRCPIGYSGHETGLAPTCAAVSLGATFVERHVTLDRKMWGSDHAASVELSELSLLVEQIRDIEKAFGDGIKRVYDSEIPVMKKLRRVRDSHSA
jgi:N-acetylneuraminate synthase